MISRTRFSRVIVFDRSILNFQDLPLYREMVTTFYSEISRMPQISDQDMCTAMQQLSIQQQDEFDVTAALKELYIYVTKYRDQVNQKNVIVTMIGIHFFFIADNRFTRYGHSRKKIAFDT